MHRISPNQNIIIGKFYYLGTKRIKRFLLGTVLDYNVNRRAWFVECVSGERGWVSYDDPRVYKPT